MHCINCDERLARGPVTLSGEYRGEDFSIEMEGVKCLACDYSTIEGRQTAEFSRRLADAYRSRHGLLTSNEVRAARMRVRMSQGEFADYLRVGIASVKRWEAGQVQDAAMDELIRLKTDLFAAERNATTVRAAVTIENPFPIGEEIVGGRTFSYVIDPNVVLSGGTIDFSFVDPVSFQAGDLIWGSPIVGEPALPMISIPPKSKRKSELAAKGLAA
jgi:putative zinc finger/helix-turn-helix YgiT family protein